MAHTTTGLDLTLLDRRSSIPLASAGVNIVWGGDRLTTEHADLHGRVAVDLPEGAYDVLIAAQGYMSSLFRGIGVLEGARVELSRALVPGEGHAEEEPAGAIGGFVLDRLNRPVMNIIVQASSDHNNYTVRSDKQGVYVLHNVIPNTYEVIWRAGDRALLKQNVVVESARQLVRVDAQLLYL